MLDVFEIEVNCVVFLLFFSVVVWFVLGIIFCDNVLFLFDELYFVMFGMIELCKNYWFMLYVWCCFVEMFGECVFKFVVIGCCGWECENVVDMFECCDVIKSVVIEELSCSDICLCVWL